MSKKKNLASILNDVVDSRNSNVELPEAVDELPTRQKINRVSELNRPASDIGDTRVLEL